MEMTNAQQVVFTVVWLAVFAILFTFARPLAWAQAAIGVVALYWLRTHR